MNNNQEYDPQDMVTRVVYIVRAKEEMIQVLSEYLDQEGLDILLKPSVVMTEEAPFEQCFESWRRHILKNCKIQFLEVELEFGELSNPELASLLNPDKDDFETFFDKWWNVEKAEDYLEIESRWLHENA